MATRTISLKTSDQLYKKLLEVADASKQTRDEVILQSIRVGLPPNIDNLPNLSPELRRQVAEDGRYRCDYCLTPPRIIGQPMAIDHIHPVPKGGQTIRDNLWLSCRRGNEFKGGQTHAVDPMTDENVVLFNLRIETWKTHFARGMKVTVIVGLASIGRETVLALRLNNDEIVAARHIWVGVGWHPPPDCAAMCNCPAGLKRKLARSRCRSRGRQTWIHT